VLRTKLTLPGAAERRIAEKFTIPRMRLSGMPLEWLVEGSWKLPSGKALAEFALQSGFLAPLLMNGGKRAKVEPSGMVTEMDNELNGTGRARDVAKGSSH